MKTVLLTGATGGIGKAIVNELKNDFQIAAWYHQQYKCAAALEVSSFHECDLANDQQIKKVFGETVKKQGSIDVLINCAGVIFPSETFADEQNIEDTVMINLVGAVLVAHEAYKGMKKNNAGIIINIASTAGVYKRRGASISYTTAKTGLLAFTKALAYECQGTRIIVCAVSPGTTDTPMLKQERVKEYIAEKKEKNSSLVVQSPATVAKVIGTITRCPQKYHGLNVVVENNKTEEYIL